MLTTATFRATLLGIAYAISLSAHAMADPARQIDVPAGELTTALQQLAKQSGAELIFLADQLKGIHTNGVHGEYTAEKAAAKLLEGTRFRVAIHDSGALLISAASSREEEQGVGETPAEPQKVRVLEEVVVTGSHIRGTAPIGSAVTVLGREQIESGYGKLQDFVETLPQNFTGVSEDFSQSGTSNLSRGSEIQLRGLGPGTTLTLINGQRQAPGGALSAFADISSIPTSAIERVEVMPDGASAIYGSDAIAGVVNVILRDDLDGAETSVRMGTAGGDADDIQLAQLLGRRWSSGHVLVGYQYSMRDALFYESRDYTAANGDMRRFGGADRRRELTGTSPGNIVNSAGTVLYAIPGGQDGTALTAGALLAGQANYFDGAGATILPEQKIHSAFLSAEQSAGDRVRIEFDARFAERESRFVLAGGAQQTVSVPSSNPFYVSPTGGSAPVLVEYDFSNDFGGFVTDEARIETHAAHLGTAIRLSDTWGLRVSGGYGEESVLQTRFNLRDSAAIDVALADTNRATALNVFGDGSANNPATIARLRTSRFDAAESSIWSAGLIADGPLFSLNGRAARLAVGADRYDQRYRLNSTFEINGRARSSRNVVSGFAELALPLLRGSAGASGLELSVAGRVDDYDDVGSTFNPKVGLSWQPVESVRMRATWGTAFRAPPFYLSNETIRPARLSTPTLTDPAAPTGRTLVLGRFGVVADLKEETAEVWTAGVDIEPSSNLRVSLTYFDIAYEDKIQQAATTAVLTLESQYAGTGIVVRSPTQAQIAEVCNQPGVTVNCARSFGAIIDFRLRNVSAVNVDGLDLAASYSLGTRFGALDVGLGGTYTFNYEEAVTSVAQPVDFIDTMGRPLSLRLRGTLGWSLKGWRASTAISYSNDYQLTPTNFTKVGSWTGVDLSAGYEFETTTRWLAGSRAQIAATNVFDERPPFVDQYVGYDPANGNLLGRTVSFQFVKRW